MSALLQADSTDVLLKVRPSLPRFANRFDREEIAVAEFWRDAGDRSEIGMPLAVTRAKMREHALRWASRRRLRSVRVLYAN